MITLRTYLRTNRKDGQGQSVIYFIVGDEWISSTIKVHPDHWDQATGSILKKNPKYYTINPIFQLYKSRAEQCISNYQTSNNSFSRQFFEQFVFASPEEAENPCILKLMDEYCEMMNLSYGRIKHFKVLKKYLVKITPFPKLHDINYSFALKLMQVLRTAGNKQNTITSKIKVLKAIVHFAQRKKLLKEDPLEMVKVKEVDGTKNHLTASELEILENLYQQGFLPAVQQAILKYFLFSCYTGLRYSDTIALKFYEIKNNCVITTQEKTDKPVVVPLITKAKALLQPGATGLCFKTHSNQVSNKYLKKIMAAAEIDKKITYHCSRHTFGTLSIYWGIPKEVVAELMGVDFKTVEIYAKIIDDVKSREMLKWEKKVG
jgi:site-specific recombinase XerD